MEHLEMVEKIRERADVTYEEAKAALEANGWDLLETLAALEREGRIKADVKETRTAEEEIRTAETELRAAEAEIRTTENEEPRKTESSGKKGIGEKIRCFFRYCRDNDIQVNRKGEIILQVPLTILLLILLIAWEGVAPIMILSLFFGVSYNFVEKSGAEENSAENE